MNKLEEMLDLDVTGNTLSILAAIAAPFVQEREVEEKYTVAGHDADEALLLVLRQGNVEVTAGSGARYSAKEELLILNTLLNGYSEDLNDLVTLYLMLDNLLEISKSLIDESSMLFKTYESVVHHIKGNLLTILGGERSRLAGELSMVDVYTELINPTVVPTEPTEPTEPEVPTETEEPTVPEEVVEEQEEQ